MGDRWTVIRGDGDLIASLFSLSGNTNPTAAVMFINIISRGGK
jgi:hypothetical protein